MLSKTLQSINFPSLQLSKMIVFLCSETINIHKIRWINSEGRKLVRWGNFILFVHLTYFNDGGRKTIKPNARALSMRRKNISLVANTIYQLWWKRTKGFIGCLITLIFILTKKKFINALLSTEAVNGNLFIGIFIDDSIFSFVVRRAEFPHEMRPTERGCSDVLFQFLLLSRRLNLSTTACHTLSNIKIKNRWSLSRVFHPPGNGRGLSESFELKAHIAALNLQFSVLWFIMAVEDWTNS
jgi:hypothetical protein